MWGSSFFFVLEVIMHVNGIPTAALPFNVDADNFDFEAFCNRLDFLADHDVELWSESDDRFPSKQALKQNEWVSGGNFCPLVRSVDVWSCEPGEV